MAAISQLVSDKGLDAETRSMVLETLREYAKKKLTPQILAELDEKNEFPSDVMKDLYSEDHVGIHLLLLPEKYGGLGGNTYDIYRACEALSAIDLGLCTSVFVTFLGMDPILVGGTDEQKEKWITKIAKEGTYVAYGATEAAAGSDLLHLATRADAVEKDGKIVAYKINGSKQWITNGGVAQLYTILARGPKGVSWFLVDGGTKGLVPEKHEDKHGIRLSNTTALSLTDVEVPADRLIGGVEGKGMRQAQAVFGYTRVMVAGMALGVGWEALRNTIKYSQVRTVGGKLLATKQGYTHKFVMPFAARLEAARAYIEETAARLDGGEAGLQVEGAVAKYLASETANLACDAAIQSHGGNGYSKEFPVEKLKRDVKITCIYEGTSEILQMTIFRKRWVENVKADMKLYDGFADEMDKLHAQNPHAGAGAAALACRALSKVLLACSEAKINLNQGVEFALGDLFAYAETALAFCRSAAKDEKPEASVLDLEGWRMLARVHARHAAAHIAGEGLRLVGSHAAEGAGALAAVLPFKEIAEVQSGNAADMDAAFVKLTEAYPA